MNSVDFLIYFYAEGDSVAEVARADPPDEEGLIGVIAEELSMILTAHEA